MKKLRIATDRDILIIIPSPEQKKTRGAEHQEEEIREKSENESVFVDFDDLSSASNISDLIGLFLHGRDVKFEKVNFCLNRILTRQKVFGKNSNRKSLVEPTLKDEENNFEDIAGFDMSLDEFNDLVRQAREEKFNYF